MTQDQLAADLQAVLTEFAEALAAIPDEALNTVPFDGSWTPGQVARHINLSNSGFLQVLNGPTKPTERPYDAAIEKLRAILLDFDARRQAPEFIVPPAIPYQKDRLLASIDKIQEALPPVFGLDLTATCTAFELPGVGHATRLEALHFMLYHTQRHLRQLRHIAANLQEANTE